MLEKKKQFQIRFSVFLMMLCTILAQRLDIVNLKDKSREVIVVNRS